MKLAAGFLASLLLNMASWILAAMGLPVVWVALYFVKPSGARIAYTQFPELGFWQMWNLPAWARWWDNVFDGMGGDKRGWWAKYCLEHYGKSAFARYCMWRWAALRNPANYFNRNVCGIDVSLCKIETLFSIGGVETAPNRGIKLLKATHASGFVFPRIRCEFAIANGKGLLFDFGWKLPDTAPSITAPDTDRIKGLALNFSPWKGLA